MPAANVALATTPIAQLTSQSGMQLVLSGSKTYLATKVQTHSLAQTTTVVQEVGLAPAISVQTSPASTRTES